MPPPPASETSAEPATPKPSASASRRSRRSCRSAQASATVNSVSVESSSAAWVAVVRAMPTSKSRKARPGLSSPSTSSSMPGRRGRAPRASAAAPRQSAPVATSTPKRSSEVSCSTAPLLSAEAKPHDSAASASMRTGLTGGRAWSVLVGPMTVPVGPNGFTDADLYRRGAATLLASWEAYARGAEGAAVVRSAGVASAVFPRGPERSVFNNALLVRHLADTERAAAIAAMEAAYATAGVSHFAAWVHETDAPARADLEARGYTLDTSTRAMGMTTRELRDARSPDVVSGDWHA